MKESVNGDAHFNLKLVKFQQTQEFLICLQGASVILSHNISALPSPVAPSTKHFTYP